MPLGAIVAKSSVMDWPSGSHASTFGGNPVSCRAALKTLELLEREYIANCHARGLQIHEGLLDLQQKHEFLANPRGLGMMRAVDVLNPASRRPDGKLRDKIVDTAFYHGLLLLPCGEAAIRFCGPMCVTAVQVDTMFQILDEVIAECTVGYLAAV